VLAQLVISDEPARNNKGILQTFSFPECDVEKGIAKICPPGLVLAAEWRITAQAQSPVTAAMRRASSRVSSFGR
jgi:hypothetical protein